ncbi:MAG: hypothetical protein L0154_03770 [Chloroflexi bacterium]|nr:hypothetical protein [Chloroflexota bacterium]
MKKLFGLLFLTLTILSPVLQTQAQSNENITDIKWHPTDNVLAVAYSNGNIEVVDQTNQTITFQQAVPPPVYEIEWSPDGTRLATSSAENILVWDITTGQLVVTLSGSSFSGDIATEAGTVQEAVYDMDWNTANQLASIAISGEFRIWNMSNSQLVVEAFVSQPGQLSWLPDNSSLLTTSGIVIVTIDPTSGAEEPWEENGGFSDPASAIMWSADGSKFAIGNGFGRVSIWDGNTDEFIDSTPITDIPVTDFAWSPDGSTIATANADGAIHLYNTETFTLQQTLLQTNSVAVAWSPDGSALAYEGATGMLVIKALPIADAGEDQTIFIGPSPQGRISPSANVTLDGTGSSDPDGTIVSYDWYQNGVLLGSGPTLIRRFFVGQTTVTLVVTDNDGLTSSDEVVITVTQIQS